MVKAVTMATVRVYTLLQRLVLTASKLAGTCCFRERESSRARCDEPDELIMIDAVRLSCNYSADQLHNPTGPSAALRHVTVVLGGTSRTSDKLRLYCKMILLLTRVIVSWSDAKRVLCCNSGSHHSYVTVLTCSKFSRCIKDYH